MIYRNNIGRLITLCRPKWADDPDIKWDELDTLNLSPRGFFTKGKGYINNKLGGSSKNPPTNNNNSTATTTTTTIDKKKKNRVSITITGDSRDEIEASHHRRGEETLPAYPKMIDILGIDMGAIEKAMVVKTTQNQNKNNSKKKSGSMIVHSSKEIKPSSTTRRFIESMLSPRRSRPPASPSPTSSSPSSPLSSGSVVVATSSSSSAQRNPGITSNSWNSSLSSSAPQTQHLQSSLSPPSPQLSNSSLHPSSTSSSSVPAVSPPASPRRRGPFFQKSANKQTKVMPTFLEEFILSYRIILTPIGLLSALLQRYEKKKNKTKQKQTIHCPITLHMTYLLLNVFCRYNTPSTMASHSVIQNGYPTLCLFDR